MRIAHHHPAPPPVRGERQRGVTLVEAAFALPVFILFLFGLIDLGSAVLQTSQTSSAAADGARAAIVIKDLTGAETSGAAHDRIVAAARARLIGDGGADATVTISCRLPSGSTYTCGTEGSLRDRTQIRVEVTWAYKPVSFVGKALPISNITGTATMGLVEMPTNFPNTTTTTAVPTP